MLLLLFLIDPSQFFNHFQLPSSSMASSPSWPSSASPGDQISSSRLRASPSPAPSWSSSSTPFKDHVPLFQRRVTGRAPARSRSAAAGASSRVGTESPMGTASTVIGQDLANIRARYRIPRSIGLFLPTPDDRVVSFLPGRIAIYELSLKLGLRLPYHPFFLNLLDRYLLTPAQLVPNSIRTICGFIVLYHFHGIEARICLFRCFYTLRQQSGWWLFQPRPNRALKLGLSSSVKGWKSRFFFANLERVRPRWGDPELRPNKDSTVASGDREALEQLLTAGIPAPPSPPPPPPPQ